MDRIIEKKEENERKIVFVETDPQDPFPKDTINALQKEVKKLAKDLTVDWNSTNQLLNKAFENLQIPLPTANLTARWGQYKQLIKDAVEALIDSRGFGASWSIL